jgi:hypothetical protein
MLLKRFLSKGDGMKIRLKIFFAFMAMFIFSSNVFAIPWWKTLTQKVIKTVVPKAGGKIHVGDAFFRQGIYYFVTHYSLYKGGEHYQKKIDGYIQEGKGDRFVAGVDRFRNRIYLANQEDGAPLMIDVGNVKIMGTLSGTLGEVSLVGLLQFLWGEGDKENALKILTALVEDADGMQVNILTSNYAQFLHGARTVLHYVFDQLPTELKNGEGVSFKVAFSNLIKSKFAAIQPTKYDVSSLPLIDLQALKEIKELGTLIEKYGEWISREQIQFLTPAVMKEILSPQAFVSLIQYQKMNFSREQMWTLVEMNVGGGAGAENVAAAKESLKNYMMQNRIPFPPSARPVAIKRVPVQKIAHPVLQKPAIQAEIYPSRVPAQKPIVVPPVKQLTPNEKLFEAIEEHHMFGIGPIERALKEGASVNAKNNLGDAPLVYAIFEGNVHLVEFLLSKGANKNIKRKDGTTPIEVARWFGGHNAHEIIRILEGKPPVKEVHHKKHHHEHWGPRPYPPGFRHGYHEERAEPKETAQQKEEERIREERANLAREERQFKEERMRRAPGSGGSGEVRTGFGSEPMLGGPGTTTPRSYEGGGGGEF